MKSDGYVKAYDLHIANIGLRNTTTVNFFLCSDIKFSVLASVFTIVAPSQVRRKP